MGTKTVGEFARAANVTPSAVTQWLNGTTKSLKAQKAAQLEAATGYRASWIVTGRGPKKVTDPDARPLDAHERAVLTNLRLLREPDREAFYEQIASAARERKLEAEEWSERLGVELPPEFRATAADHETFAAAHRPNPEPPPDPPSTKRRDSA